MNINGLLIVPSYLKNLSLSSQEKSIKEVFDFIFPPVVVQLSPISFDEQTLVVQKTQLSLNMRQW